VSRRPRRVGHREGKNAPHAVLLPTEIGQLLCAARDGRGLSLLEVHDRTGLPITQLEAIESGEYHLIPHPAYGLSTLRRYADFLLLPAEDLTVSFMQHVPALAPSVVSSPVSPPEASPPRPSRDGLSDSAHLRAFNQTTLVPAVGTSSGGAPTRFAGIPDSANGSWPMNHDPATEALHMSDVTAQALAKRHRRKAPLVLRLGVWLLCFLLVVSGGGLAVDHWRPRWMSPLHIVRSTLSSALPKSPKPSTPRATPVVAFQQVAASANQVAYNVDAAMFTVTVTATARCWVQVTTDQSVAPVFRGVQPPGWNQAFQVTGRITVQLGASGALVVVSAGHRTIGTFTPTAAPVTVTLTGLGSPQG
jgi:transcriptional regulator with XRE-family HTH domain